MGRSPSNVDVKKGPWDPEEDKKLSDYINQHGPGNWTALPKLACLNRCGKSCRLRWINYLRPEIKRGGFTLQEEHTILQYHKILGNKWSLISRKLPGRTDNEIKNFWNTHMKKKLIRAGCDPTTHQPRTDLISCLRSLLTLANLNNMILSQDYKLPYLEHVTDYQVPTQNQMVNPISLLNQNPSLNSVQQHEATMFQPLHHPNDCTTPHVPIDYNSSKFQPTTSLDDGLFVQSLDFDGLWNMEVPSYFPSTSISNAGEVTSYDNGSEEEEEAYLQWAELLTHPVMHQ